jgi:hypothetical protein
LEEDVDVDATDVVRPCTFGVDWAEAGGVPVLPGGGGVGTGGGGAGDRRDAPGLELALRLLSVRGRLPTDEDEPEASGRA